MSFLLLFLFFLTNLFTATAYSQNQDKHLDGLAAIVGDNIILKSDLSQLVSMAALQQQINPAND